MLKRKYLKLCLEIIFVLVLIVGGGKVLEHNITLPVYDSD